MTPHLYDTIGKSYAQYRRPDPRIAAAILKALGDAATVINIGAGTGSYEPTDRAVIAVEPSEIMIRQRAASAAPALRASGMHLPFHDDAFEAATALLTVHHWPDPLAGLREMMRVARRCVIFSWEPSTCVSWLIRDYFPEIRAYDRTIFPMVGDFYARAFPRFEIVPVPVPHDCADGFLEAYWRRPEAYFDSGVRLAISSFSHATNVAASLERLRRDLDDGAWARRNEHLMELSELDLGYRLIIAER
jgi:SAM-dependent methyltransferase